MKNGKVELLVYENIKHVRQTGHNIVVFMFKYIPSYTRYTKSIYNTFQFYL